MSLTQFRSVVRGVGACLPERVLTNAELATRSTRRMNGSGSAPASASAISRRGRDDVHARRRAPQKSRCPAPGSKPPTSISSWSRTSTPDYTFPAVATQIQADLGITHGVAFDLQAVCSGFVFAVTTADKFLASGSHKRALVIGAETFSRLLDWSDRTTCVLFGDGAGAVVLEAVESDGSLASPGVICHASCARTAATAQNSTSTAAPRRPRRLAICAWKARRCSSTPSAWSPT